MFRYAVTIFLSAFLLFQVQPLIGKFILPWFGGTPTVWTTCMLFFQAALLAGYSYAHFISSKVSPKGQMLVHLVLLLVSLSFLPIAPDPLVWKPTDTEMPIGRILLLLGATIGLPYFMLSTTGPLLQESYRRETGHPPYRLYSLSNAGSLLALLSYPFVFEPELTLKTQISGWSIGYVVFAVFCAWCALAFTRPAAQAALAADAADAASAATVAAPTAGLITLWLALAACGSALLLATTNQLCQEITAVPFLWVVPLAIYLLTFIICFDHERWYHRNTFLALLAVGVLAACYAIYEGPSLPIELQLGIYSATLFVCCMVVHGELVSSKPAAHYATLFYLIVSAGGVIGGVLVAIVAPLVLHDLWEYQITLVVTVLLAFLATARRQRAPQAPAAATQWVAGGGISVALGLTLAWATGLFGSSSSEASTNLDTMRNFYGVLRVLHYDDPAEPREKQRVLIHGRIPHGYQYLDEDRSRLPVSYFGPRTGIGLSCERHPRRLKGEPMKIGITGLGCGTVAAYGRPGDTVRYYEINPDVIDVAKEYFTYLRDCKADVELVLGDARIELEQEVAAGDSQQFDVLMMDAFSSDSIPMHLLTAECVATLKEHMKPDGVIIYHITNRFVNLSGVVRALAESVGLQCVIVESDRDREQGLKRAWQCLLTNNQEFLSDPEVQKAIRPWNETDPGPILWTDDYGSLWKVLD